jgi:hypothetical protein
MARSNARRRMNAAIALFIVPAFRVSTGELPHQVLTLLDGSIRNEFTILEVSFDLNSGCNFPNLPLSEIIAVQGLAKLNRK